MLTHEIKNVGKVYDVKVYIEIDGRKEVFTIIAIGENVDQVKALAETYTQEESPSCKILNSTVSASLILI